MSDVTEHSPILVLPEDETERKKLQGKLDEYLGRILPYCPPEQQMDTICKITVLRRLLQDGQVNTWNLCLEMKETYGSGFDPDKFGVACGVINEYCKGGKNVQGGTGLPNVNE